MGGITILRPLFQKLNLSEGIKMKNLNIDWLESCPICLSKVLQVRTNGNYENLICDEKVSCECGNTGYIDVCSNNAFVCWDELSELELKYNVLKIMYDNAVSCLMESNYGDASYLRGRGVII